MYHLAPFIVPYGSEREMSICIRTNSPSDVSEEGIARSDWITVTAAPFRKEIITSDF
jgi:hypothetical protein